MRAGESAMPDIKKMFEDAAAAAKSLKKRPSDDDLLALYALYKQATAGDVSGERPGFFDFVGAAKFDAWTALKGVSKAEAMHKYIAKVNALKD
jgi:diazepam-binding inhibitor (GABA receptor modulator, acyl-CoA-binding protein)